MSQLSIPIDLPFPHHTIGEDEPEGDYDLLGAEAAKPVAEPTASDVPLATSRLRAAGVVEIVLIHGTFAGHDSSGVLRSLGLIAPTMAGRLAEISKSWFDEFAGEVGNYTDSFAECLSSLVNPPGEDPIPVTRLNWSGENHTLGRAQGAIALLDHLQSRPARTNQRVLIFAHSHGGNVVAMLSQLLAASDSARNQFYASAVKDASIRTIHFNSLPILDVASFGTPLRYRWDTRICHRLLHFVHHRPRIDRQPTAAEFPSSPVAVLQAVAGDYVQHLAIAGTDFVPLSQGYVEWAKDRRLRAMFESEMRSRDLVERMKRGRRVSCDGTTLLVDYPADDSGWNRKLLGHGIYTSRQWLPFHLREITSRFYG